MKQIMPDPWTKVGGELSGRATRFKGKVVSVTDYGAFVELEKGVEGLIHVSEMSWSKRAVHPSKVVNPGDMVEVQVLGRRRGQPAHLARTQADRTESVGRARRRSIRSAAR